MSGKNVLDLWLSGEHLGEVERLRTADLRLRFDPRVVADRGAGTRLVSYSIPLTTRRVESRSLDTFLDNLLPEGAVRAQLERQHGVRPGDMFGLLSHIGQECAGAIQLTRGTAPGPGHLVPLAPAEVARIVEDLPTLSAPDGGAVTASLGGVQSKVLLTRTDTGWAWPAGGAMSSHIVKPEPTDPNVPIPAIIEYEHWAMNLARASGLPAARCELERFGDRLALVVERYDRANGTRLHQEDFAQALGLSPGDKYEPPGPGAGRLQRIVRGVGAEAPDPRALARDLLALVTFNVLVGNGDAHAKNYSLTLDNGRFHLAPAYDVAPVFYVNDRFRDFGMTVDGQRGLRYITATHLIAEGVSWGMPPGEAAEVVGSTSDAVLAALGSVSVTRLTEPIAERIRDTAGRFARRFRSSSSSAGGTAGTT